MKHVFLFILILLFCVSVSGNTTGIEENEKGKSAALQAKQYREQHIQWHIKY